MDPTNYFIKSGYKNQKFNHTLSTESGNKYWTNQRIYLSNFYQYSVYTYACELIKKHNLKTVVDVGSGVATKLMKIIYPHCKNVTGIDQEEAIEYCKKNYSHGKFYVDNLEKSKLKLGKYDLIICADVIEHMINPDNLLKLISSLSHKNTYIVISTPERDILRGKNNIASPKVEHVREWNKKELITYVKNRGFEVVEHKYVYPTKPSCKTQVKNLVLDLFRSVKSKSNQLLLCKLKL